MAVAMRWVSCRLFPRQQCRSVYVDVKNDNLDQAMAKYVRKLRNDKVFAEVLDRKFYIKPCQKRVLAKKARDRRISGKDFRDKLKKIIDIRARSSS